MPSNSAPNIIEALNTRLIKRIPALAGGILLMLFAVAHGADTPLWHSLFNEGDWTGARREALRADPGDLHAQVVLHACRLRLGSGELSASVAALEEAVQTPGHPAAATAALERGRYAWHTGDSAAAWTWFAKAFRRAHDPDVYQAAGAALTVLARRQRRRLAADPELAAALKAGREHWTEKDRKGLLPDRGSLLSRLGYYPLRAGVVLYRKGISPAIGHRCNLHPSCSEFFLIAARRNGLLAVPMIGDRWVREPGLQHRPERAVVIGDMILYADPVEDHEFWRSRDE